MASDKSQLEILLDDKTDNTQQSLSGFIGFGPEAGLVSGLTNVHPAIAVVTTAAQALANGLDSVRTMALDMAQELRPYSGAVASAFALNEVDRINMLLARDAKMGDDIAELVRTQNEVDMLLEDIKTQLFTIIAPLMRSILKVVEALIPLIEQSIEGAKSYAMKAMDWVVENYVNGFGQWMYGIWKNSEDAKKPNSHLQDVLNFLNQPAPEQKPFQERNLPGGIF